MIIYNHKKEFVGIEKKDLQALKLENLAELQNEVADFADLFVKTPGYIHNFKHVHWIDFIASADSIDENRVIISVKGKNYKATIDLKTLYLIDEPQKEAYGISLGALRELTKEENERISGDLQHRSVARATDVDSTPPSFDLNRAQEDENKEDSLTDQEIQEEPLTLDFEDIKEQEEQKQTEEPLEISLDDVMQEEHLNPLQEEDKFKDYHFDPGVAAKELGLPLDLVEEFIQDFIAQAREFKPELYEALQNGRIDNLRMLSHKLKGVAANLRIEDAYDALLTINTADDIDLVKRTLDHFYNVILKKIAGESVEIPNKTEPIQNKLKEEPIEITPEDTIQEISLEDVASDVSTTDQEEKIDLDLDDEVSLKTDEPKRASQEDEQKIELAPPLELSIQENEEEPLALDIEDEKEEPLEISLEENEVQQEQVDEGGDIMIDKEKIAREIGVDLQTFNELIGDYVSDMKAGIVQLEELLEDKESSDKLALRLKGMSDNMHFDTISKELEEFIKDEDKRVALLNKMKTQIDFIERM